jgi:hypothetical protein
MLYISKRFENSILGKVKLRFHYYNFWLICPSIIGFEATNFSCNIISHLRLSYICFSWYLIDKQYFIKEEL